MSKELKNTNKNTETKKDWRKNKNVQPLRTAEEVKNMREALMQTEYPRRNKLLFDLGINTGLRISDLVPLQVKDVKGKSEITLWEQKTEKIRKVYIGMLMPEIASYVEGKAHDDYLFSSRRGGHITTTQGYRILVAAGKKCGYDYVGSHTLRKTFGYFYYKKTRDVATLMEIFNHDSQNVTLRYIGVRDDEVRSSLVDFKI